MKKLFIILFSLILVIFGCEKESPQYTQPSISFITDSGFVYSDTTLKLGETFKIGIDASSPNVNVTNFIIRVESDKLETFFDSGMNTPDLHYKRYITKGIAESEKWIFIINDRNGISNEISFYTKLDSLSNYGDIEYFPSVDLGAQNNSIGSFFSLAEDSIYTLNSAFNNQDNIDICYYYDFIDTDENTIASPGANIDTLVYEGESGLSNWETRKTTRYKTVNITEEDFFNATNDSLLIATYGQSDGNRKAKNLQSGSIISFKNENGKVGLFKVNYVSGTDEGTINISIKVQE